MTRIRSLRRAKIIMERRSPSGQRDTPNQGEASKIYMIEKKFMNQKRHLLVFNNASKPGSYNEDSDGSDKEYGNRKHSALTRQGKSKRSNFLIGGGELVVQGTKR